MNISDSPLPMHAPCPRGDNNNGAADGSPFLQRLSVALRFPSDRNIPLPRIIYRHITRDNKNGNNYQDDLVSRRVARKIPKDI